MSRLQWLLWWAKVCPTRARIADFAVLERAIGSGIGLFLSLL